MPPQEPEFAPVYTREDRIRHALVAFGVALLVIFGCNFVLFPKLLQFANHAQCQTVFGVSGVALVMSTLLIGLPLAVAIPLAVFVVPRAVAAIRTRQYPAPGRKVTGKVRIRRGRTALLNGWVDLAIVSFPVAIAIWGTFETMDIARSVSQTKMDCVRVPEQKSQGDHDDSAQRREWLARIRTGVGRGMESP